VLCGVASNTNFIILPFDPTGPYGRSSPDSLPTIFTVCKLALYIYIDEVLLTSQSATIKQSGVQ